MAKLTPSSFSFWFYSFFRRRNAGENILYYPQIKANLFLLSLFLMALFIPACHKERQVTFNSEFSINIGKPGRDFPVVKHLTQAKREIYEFYGPPDYVRLWWSDDGRIHRFLEVDRRLKDKRQFSQIKRSWIYLDKDMEFLFIDETSYRETPLGDKVRIICTYGDPEDIKKTSDTGGALLETWNYYSIGLILKFKDGRLVGQQRHPPMGSVIKL